MRVTIRVTNERPTIREGWSGVVTTGWANLTGKEPLAPLEGVKMARKKMFVTHAKAARELGFSPGQSDAALRRAVSWFCQNGYC